MEFLKMVIIVGALIVLPQYVKGQDFDTKREAFSNSYKLEVKGDYLAAIGKLTGVYDDKSYEINLRLGWLSYLAGDYPASINYYNKAILIMPYSIEPRFGIAYPLNALGSINELLEQYKKIVEITPNNSVAYYWIGVIYYNRADYVNAKKNFEKVLNLYPFDYDGLVMSGWTQYQLGNTREARVLFQKALLNNPLGESALEGLNLVK